MFWKRLTYSGALAGIIAGFATDILWYVFMGWTNVYEIIPGFFAGTVVVFAVSKLSAPPSKEVEADFENAGKKCIDISDDRQ